MGSKQPSQATLDMAREWVNENYPELEGDEYDRKVLETALELECTSNNELVSIRIK